MVHRIPFTLPDTTSPKRICVPICNFCGEAYDQNWSYSFCSRRCAARSRSPLGASTAQKKKARAVLNYAVRSGKIKRGVCACGATKTHGHHYRGYSRCHWLDVEWKCAKCHPLAEGRYSLPNANAGRIITVETQATCQHRWKAIPGNEYWQICVKCGLHSRSKRGEKAHAERYGRTSTFAAKSPAPTTGTEVAPKRWKSCARWPADCCPAIGNYSEDWHDTREQAWAVCHILRRDGFGGDGKYFPLKVWVEELAATFSTEEAQ